MAQICEGCGGSFGDDASFCPYCGRGIIKTIEIPDVRPDPINACPVCHLNDKVEKVSAIYQHGSQRSNLSIPVANIGKDSNNHYSSYTTYEKATGYSETQLAQRLRPPVKPTPPDRSFFRPGIYTEKNACFLIFLFMVLLPVVPVILIQVLINNFGQSDLLTISGAIIGGIIVIFVAYISMNSFNSQRKGIERTEDGQYQNALTKWNEDMKRWDNMYYCFRDDKVFISKKDS